LWKKSSFLCFTFFYVNLRKLRKFTKVISRKCTLIYVILRKIKLISPFRSTPVSKLSYIIFIFLLTKRYNISSKTVEVFAQLAGGSDNVRISDQGTLFVPFALVNGYFENNKPYGLAAEYDLNGTVIRSWHDPNGTKIDQTTHIELYGNKLYFGSFSGDGMAVLDMANGAGEDGSLRGCKWILEFLMKLVKMVKNVWYYY
jgi:hypothetical protein